MPRGSNTPQLCCASSLIPRQLAAGFLIASFCQGINKRVYLVMDNAPWHKKAKRLIESEEEYADIRKAVTIKNENQTGHKEDLPCNG